MSSLLLATSVWPAVASPTAAGTAGGGQPLALHPAGWLSNELGGESLALTSPDPADLCVGEFCLSSVFSL